MDKIDNNQINKNTQGKEIFVVFLDIMGFKDRVARTGFDKLYEELLDFNCDITDIVSKCNTPLKNEQKEEQVENQTEFSAISSFDTNSDTVDELPTIRLAQFSDSIVLFSKDDSKESLECLSKVAKGIMESAIVKRENPIPLKGAFAKGKVACDLSKQLFFGQALIDAYLLEENVQYYGIVVHHSAEKDIKNYSLDLFSNKKIPLKVGGEISHYELSWYADCSKKAKEGLNALRLTVSDSPRKYIDNTEKVINIQNQ